MNINKFLNEEYRDMSFRELSGAPFNAVKGVSESTARRIRETFKPKTLSKYVDLAEAIVMLAEGEVSE